MIISFANKVVIITGGTRGIGASLVEAFYGAGAKVIVTGTKEKINPDRVSTRRDENYQYHQLDLTSDDSIERFKKIITKLGRVDVLINNAGVNKINSFGEISDKDWDWINAVNLRGPFQIASAVVKAMKIQGSGKILNVASIFGVVSKEKRAAYSASKWGLLGLTKASALDLAPFNVLVNAISPGFVDTDLTHKILGPENIKAIANSIPQKRLANPDEIALVALFLCSDKNTYITGQNIIVDGGFTSA